MATILVEHDGDVVTLTLNRPDKLNSLNEELLRELQGALRTLDEDPTVRAGIVTGAGDKAFAAGADIAAMREMTASQALRFAELGHRVGAAFEQARIPFIAAVNGFALGGGCESRWRATSFTPASAPSSGSRRSHWGSCQGSEGRRGSPGGSGLRGRESCA